MNPTVQSDADRARQIATAQLARGPRLAHGALLAVALTMTVMIASLLLTEPILPLRTRLAFVALMGIGIGWSGYAGWVLIARHVLFARQRVLAGWLALVSTMIFTSGAFAIGAAAGVSAGFVAGWIGLGLIALSIVLLALSRRRLAELLERERSFENLLTGKPGSV